MTFIIPNLDLVNTNAHAKFGHKILSGKENQTSIKGQYSVRKVRKTICTKVIQYVQNKTFFSRMCFNSLHMLYRI